MQSTPLNDDFTYQMAYCPFCNKEVQVFTMHCPDNSYCKDCGQHLYSGFNEEIKLTTGVKILRKKFPKNVFYITPIQYSKLRERSNSDFLAKHGSWVMFRLDGDGFSIIKRYCHDPCINKREDILFFEWTSVIKIIGNKVDGLQVFIKNGNYYYLSPKTLSFVFHYPKLVPLLAKKGFAIPE